MQPASSSSSASVINLYRSIWLHARGARMQLVGSALLLIGSQLIKLSIPWLTAQAINALQQGGASSGLAAAGWVASIVLVYGAAWALHGPGRVLERSVGVRVRQGLADALYAKLARAPLAWHERNHSGDVQHRVNQASHALYNFAQSQFIYLQNAVSFVGPLVALALLSPSTGMLAFAGYVIVAVVILRFDMALMRLAVQENQAERRYAAGLLDFIGNIATVMSLRLQGTTRRLLGRRLDAVFAPLKRAIVLNEMKWCAVDLLSVCLTWSLVAAFVWRSHGAGSAVLMGTLFMIYQYAQQAGSVIGSMAENFQNFARTRTDFASADAIWQAPEREMVAAPLTQAWDRLSLKDISFEHTPVQADSARQARGGLHHVSLTLLRGERIALVGPSGSGKSTLMRVMAGLYEPQHGRFEADGSPMSPIVVGAMSTLIPQEADVFEASVRENIAFDLPCERSDIDRAIRVSAFDEVLVTMKDGLDTPIVERGFNMSGGQRQRLCLARGVLAARDSSIVLLDEPTSALDPVTEASVFENLGRHFIDSTIIASVHRMSLLKHFDRVVLMVGGHLVDVGTVEELSSRQPMFANMLKGQSAKEETAV